MRILKARFRTRDDLLEAYAQDLPEGGLFVPTTTPLEPGDDVIVEIICDELPDKVLLRSKVLSWRPALPRLRVRAGALVAFEQGERAKNEFLLGRTKKGGNDRSVPRRKNIRIPVAMPVRFRQRGSVDLIEGVLADISISGALLRSDGAPPAGSDVVMSLLPPGGAAPMEIEGTVSFRSPDGAAGVKFTFRHGGGSRRLRELIRRICAA